MKPCAVAYARAESLEEALALLSEYGDDAKAIAGGQSLVPMMNLRLAAPAVLVDVTRIAGLDRIDLDDGALTIGASVRQRTAERSEAVRRACPLLPSALAHVGHLHIRTRGTVGGSVAHADPASELCAAALALDATVLARSRRGPREIAAADFLVGPYTTALDADELVVGLRIPASRDRRYAFDELAPRHGDYALAGVCLAASVRDGALHDVRLAGLAVASTAVRLHEAERACEGAPASAATAAAAGAAAAREAEPFDGLYGDAPYRRTLLGVLVERAIGSVIADA